MTKYIIVSEGGFKWAIPLETVVEHRAKYYAEIDKDATYQAEFDQVMADEDQALDWLQNNMNWSDITPRPVLIMKPEIPDEPDDFCNAEMDIEEIDGEFASVE